jgi:hypothetical protein
VARKVLVQKEDFQKETENLKYLKRSLLKHDRIATFLAIISIETGSYTEFNILSELAAMNLQEFLDEKHIEFEISPQTLMPECAHLADALRFLHKGIEIPRGGDAESDSKSQEGPMTCHHMDLKPENILVYIHRDHPVGIWKISDFGISRIKGSVSRQLEVKQRNDKGLLEVPRMLGELKRSMNSQPNHTSRTNAKRYSGTWQAPEVHQSREKVVGIASDVWSFGCILVSIIALALGPDVLASLEANRGKTKDGIHYDFDDDDRFYRTINGVADLNPHIKSWVELLPQRAGHSPDFLLNSRDILFGALEIDPTHRISSGNLHQTLKRIFLPHSKAPSNGSDSAVSATNNTIQVPGPSSLSALENLKASTYLTGNLDLIHGESTSRAETQSKGHSQRTTEKPNSHLSLEQAADVEDDASAQDRTPTPLPKGKGREISQTLAIEADVPKIYLGTDIPTLATKILQSPPVDPSRISTEDHFQDASVRGPSNPRDQHDFPIPHRHIDRTGSLPVEPNRTLLDGGGKVHKKRSLTNRPIFSSGKVPMNDSFMTDFAPAHSFAAMTNGYHPTLSNDYASKSSPGTLALGSHSASETPRNRPIAPKNAKSTPSTTRSPPPWPIDSERIGSRPRLSHSRVNSLRSEANQSSHTSSSSGISNFVGQPVRTNFQLHPSNGKNIIKAIMSSDCTLVAFLSSTNIYVYALRGEEHPCRELQRPHGWKWISVSISGGFIFARGQVANGRTVVSREFVYLLEVLKVTSIQFRIYEVIWESNTKFEIEPEDPSPESNVEGGVISCTGYQLYQQQSEVLLAHME